MRSIWLLLSLLLLFVAPPARAGEPMRAIHLRSGAIEEGWIVQREDDYLVLRQRDGALIEILLSQVDRIELVDPRFGEPLDEDLDDDDREDRSDRYDRDYDDSLDRGPRHSQELELATVGHKLSVAPMIPLMIAGLSMTVGSSFFDPNGFTAVGIMLSGGSVGFAMGGAGMALAASEDPDPAAQVLFKLGSALALTGLAMTDTVAIVRQNVDVDDSGAMIATVVTVAGVMSTITGNIVLASSAKRSHYSAPGAYDAARRPVAVPWLVASTERVQGGFVLVF